MSIFIKDKDGNVLTYEDSSGNTKNLEYRYLEYRQSDGYVIKIYVDKPSSISNGNKLAIADNRNFEEGYEYSNYIVVQTVDESGNLQSSCMIKQPESVKYLREERGNLLKQLTTSTQTIATMTLQAADLQKQLQTAAQTIASMQIGGN